MLQSHDLSNLPRLTGKSVHILQSKWHDDLTGCMERKARQVLEASGITDVVTHVLPGCLEFPYAAKEIMEVLKPDAVIAIGIILKGDTRHFETVNDECARGLVDLSLEYRVPMLNAILPVFDMGTARERASDDDKNKGLEAALAAVEILAWRETL